MSVNEQLLYTIERDLETSDNEEDFDEEEGSTLSSREYLKLKRSAASGGRIKYKVEYEDDSELFRMMSPFRIDDDMTRAARKDMKNRAGAADRFYRRLFVDGEIWSLTAADNVDFDRGVGRFYAEGSDTAGNILNTGSKITRVTFYLLDPEQSGLGIFHNTHVSYYPFLNDSPFDLDHAQIYKNADAKNDNSHCLIYTIQQWALDHPIESKTVLPLLENVYIKHIFGGSGQLSTRLFASIADDLGVRFSVSRTRHSTDRESLTRKNSNFGNIHSKTTINIGVVQGHVFYNRPFPELKTHSEYMKVLFPNPDKKLARAMRVANPKLARFDSFQVIMNLLNQKTPGQKAKGRIGYLQRKLAPFTEERGVRLTADQKTKQFELMDLYSNIEPCREEAAIIRAEERALRAAESGTGGNNKSSQAYEDKGDLIALKYRFPLATTFFAADCESQIGDKIGVDSKQEHSLYLFGVGAIPRCGLDTKVFISENITDGIEYVNTEVEGPYNELIRKYRESYKKNELILALLTPEKLREHIANPIKKPFYRVIIYIHNLRYDQHVIQNALPIMKVCEKGGITYSFTVSCRLPGVVIEFRDSLKHLSMPIRDFPKALSLPSYFNKKSDGIYYTYFKHATRGQDTTVGEYIQSRPFGVSEGKALLDVANLLTEVRECSQDVTMTTVFNPDQIYKYYLEFDVKVLVAGLSAYRTAMYGVCYGLSIRRLDPLNKLTISSFSRLVMKESGVFDWVPSYKGQLREYIMDSVHGGRCNPHNNHEGTFINRQIADLDAVGLYPSAMSSLSHFTNLKPVKLTAKNILGGIAFLRSKADRAVLTIRITKVNRRLEYAQPIICVTDSDGILQFTQDIPSEGLEVTIHLFDLYSYIKMHEIEFTILWGIYWPFHTETDKGVRRACGIDDHKAHRPSLTPNDAYPKLSLALHELRKEFRRKFGVEADPMDNVMQLLCKLLGNSSYGGMIMKASHEELKILPKFVTDEDGKRVPYKIDNYAYNQSGTMKRWFPTEHNWFVTRFHKDVSSTYTLYGSTVLAQSRVIMNRVWEACERAEATIFYTDTDSIMVPQEKLGEIERQYNLQRDIDFKNGYEYPTLTGKEQQQFHTDYSKGDFCVFPNGQLGTATSTWPKLANDANIYSSGMYLVRKKCYLHLLECPYTDSKGQPQIARGIAFRMKGSTKVGIVKHAYDLALKYNDPTHIEYNAAYQLLHPDYTDLSQRGLIYLYQDLIDGKEHSIVLNPGERSKFYYKTGRVFTSDKPVARSIKKRQRTASVSSKTTKRVKTNVN